jgi:hypothetical protein
MSQHNEHDPDREQYLLRMGHPQQFLRLRHHTIVHHEPFYGQENRNDITPDKKDIPLL